MVFVCLDYGHYGLVIEDVDGMPSHFAFYSSFRAVGIGRMRFYTNLE